MCSHVLLSHELRYIMDYSVLIVRKKVEENIWKKKKGNIIKQKQRKATEKHGAYQWMCVSLCVR